MKVVIEELEALQDVLHICQHRIDELLSYVKKPKQEENAATEKTILGKSCLNCTYVNASQVLIKCKKYNQQPPPHIIENGCPDFDLDDIPF